LHEGTAAPAVAIAAAPAAATPGADLGWGPAAEVGAAPQSWRRAARAAALPAPPLLSSHALPALTPGPTAELKPLGNFSVPP